MGVVPKRWLYIQALLSCFELFPFAFRVSRVGTDSHNSRAGLDCIASGNDKLANPVTNKDIGVLIDPIMETFERSSIMTPNDVIPQAKNIKDSYKLLNGK